MEKEKPKFDLVTLTPPMVYGPLRHTIQSTHDLNQSNARIYSGFVNSSKDAESPPSKSSGYLIIITDDKENNNFTRWPPYIRRRPRKLFPLPTPISPSNLPQDLAEAHVLAATRPEASGQRFIVCEGQISSQNISDILRENIPELEKRTPIGIPGDKGLEDGSFTCSSDKIKNVLGLNFRSKEDTFVDLARQLLNIEKREKGGE